ncbi:hypothetical protein MMC25_003592 [Agyrium rufum]|nr:hypothetical protein [Agyrium rufum]
MMHTANLRWDQLGDLEEWTYPYEETRTRTPLFIPNARALMPMFAISGHLGGGVADGGDWCERSGLWCLLGGDRERRSLAAALAPEYKGAASVGLEAEGLTRPDLAVVVAEVGYLASAEIGEEEGVRHAGEEGKGSGGEDGGLHFDGLGVEVDLVVGV